MKGSLRILVVGLAAALFLGSAVQAGEYSPDFGAYLADHQQDETVGAVVTMVDQVDLDALKQELNARRADRREWHEAVVLALQEKATNTQADIIAQLDELAAQGKVEKYRNLWISNIILVNANREALDKIVSRNDVEMIYPDYEIENIEPVNKGEDSPTIAGVENGLRAIRADEVWAMGITGTGRLVSHLDTGVDGNHPALNARWRGYDSRYDGHPEWAWFDPLTNTQFPQDWGQHGTHTMGTICGLGQSSGDTIGVAFGAQWISCGVIDRQSIPRTVQDALAAFEWVADPDGNPNTVWDVPDVCSNSWGLTSGHGYPPCDQTFWSVLDGCEAAGIFVVFAAGNEGPGARTLRNPATRATTDIKSFSVGALDGNNNNYPIASFSSRGPSDCTPDGSDTFKPEVSAPGVNVRSSVPGGGYAGGWSGTSMACPHVAGVIALMREANPNLTTDQIGEILLATASDLGDPGEDNAYGMGIVDAYEAVLLSQAYLQGWGTLAGYITDQASGDPIQGANVSVVGRPWSATSNGSGFYRLFMPADTLWDIRVENPPNHLPAFDQVMVVENETTWVDYALEGKVTVTLNASFANPQNTYYRSFYLKGSWDNDGFYDASWSGDLIEVSDPNQDGIYTGQVLLARDTQHNYSWAIYSENYGGEAARLDDGADFSIPDLNPPSVPTLAVNPSGSDNNWIISVEGDNGLSTDLAQGVDNAAYKWGASIQLVGNTTYTFKFHVMHSDAASYGSGGVGGPSIVYTPEVDGAFDFIFNDNTDTYVIQLTGTEGPPTYLGAVSGLDGHIPVSWLPPGTIESQEMAYDDGTLANAYYYFAYENLMATMFVPQSHPVTIDSVMIHVLTEGDPYWPWPDGTADPIGISVFLDNGSGMPENSPVYYTEATVTPGEWIRVSVGGISVTDGNFWVAMNNLAGGGEEGIGLDANTDYPGNKWAFENGAWGQQNIYNGDHMIRAKVFGGGRRFWIGYDSEMVASLPDNVPVFVNPEATTGSAMPANPGSATDSRIAFDRSVYTPKVSRTNPPMSSDTEILAGYNLYRDVATAPFDRDMKINTDLITDTFYDDWGNDAYGPIHNGTMYYYQCSAVYDIGGGQFVEVGPSNEATATPQNHAPANPQNLVGSSLGNTVTLNWDPNTDYDIAQYRIFRRDYGSNDFVLAGTVDHPTVEFQEDLLVDGIYRYKVAAVDADGMQSDGFSNNVDIPIGTIPPRQLTATTNLEFQIDLAWRHPGLRPLIPNLNVLVIAADNANQFLAELAAFDDIDLVDYYDARTGTPTLEQLADYDAVVVWSNYQFSDPMGMGNVLADYADNGGGVILQQFSFGTGWNLQGRIMNEYSPFSPGQIQYNNYNLGDYDSGNPIMEGVSAVSDMFASAVSIINGGVWVADWDSGLPFVAHNPDLPVVGINGYIGDSRQFTGDMIMLVHNAINFTAGGSQVIPDNYVVYKSDSPNGPFNSIVTLPGDQTNYTDSPVPNGVDYWYFVTAVYPGPEESDPSNVAMGNAENHPPLPPVINEPIVNDRDVELTWTFNDVMGDLDHFVIYRQLMPFGDVTPIGTSVTESYTDVIGEGEDGTYGYQVTAVDDGSPQLESGLSDQVYALVGHLPPSGLVATSGYEFAIPLAWNLPGSWRMPPNPDNPDDRILSVGKDARQAFDALTSVNEPTNLDLSHKGDNGQPNPPVILDQGGPDEFGYTWIDSDEPGGPTYNWVDITDRGFPISMTDDSNQGPYDLGFTFSFYDVDFTTFRVCSNGWVSFTSNGTSYFNGPIPDPSAMENLLAPFWDDLNPSSGGQVWAYSSSDSAIVSWIGVPHYGSGGPYTFQVIILRTGAIIYQYQSMGTPTNSATIGIQNGDGSIGLQVAYDQDYIHDQMAIKLSAGPEGVPPDHYILYRSLTSPVPTEPENIIVDNIPGVAEEYVDIDGIENGVTYYYVLSAVWFDGIESPPSNEASASATNYPPESPINLAGSVDGRDVSLTWDFTNNMGDLYQFNIYKKLMPDGAFELDGASTEPSYVATIPMGEDGTYAFAVTAVDDGSPNLESEYSNQVFMPVGNLPPMNLRATSNQDGVVPLAWSEPGLSPRTTLSYDDGTLANAYYYFAFDNIMANQFVASSPVVVETLWVHVLTEGDPYWPWPDGNHDPVGISLWDDDGSGMPGEMAYYAEATCNLGEWISVAIEGGATLNGPNFWVGLQNLEGGGEDGIGLDANTDYPQFKWAREDGGWYQQNIYNGDHMIRATIIDSGRRRLRLDEETPTAPLAIQAGKVSAMPGMLSEKSGMSDIPQPLDVMVLLGYNVYRSTTPNVPIDDDHRVNPDYVVDTHYDDDTVTNGTTYYYVVTAMYDNDSVIEESGPSNEVTATPRSGAMMVIDPSEFSVNINSGEVLTETMNIANPGGLALEYSITVTQDRLRRGGNPRPDGDSGIRHIAPVNKVTETAKASDMQFDVGQPGDGEIIAGSRNGLTISALNSHYDSPAGRGDDDSILIPQIAVLVIAADNADLLVSDLSAFGDISYVDLYDARNGTPTLEELSNYDAVVVWSNYQFYDSWGMGDVLADYADQGGGVVLHQFCFGSGWDLQGRIMNEYSPFSAGGITYMDHYLGDYDDSHPLMADVSYVFDVYVSAVSVINDGVVVASWDDGTPFVGYNPNNNVVAINAYVGDSRQFDGDMITITHNALNFSSGGSWLNVDPRNGIVNPGADMDIDVIFNATDLEEGQYTGSLVITGYDENHMVGQITVPVTMIVNALGVDDDMADLPTEFGLSQNYPNPFNPTTEINFALPENAHVNIEVFNVLGQKVRTLVDTDMEAGYQKVTWNGRDDQGAGVSSGIYLYRMKAGDQVFTKKMMMLK